MATRLSAVAMLFLGGTAFAQADAPLYRDATQPVEVRVDDLLHRMTLAEKVGQINMPCVYVGGLGSDVPSKTEGCRKRCSTAPSGAS